MFVDGLPRLLIDGGEDSGHLAPLLVDPKDQRAAVELKPAIADRHREVDAQPVA